jgi:hypothetical protein
MTLRQIETYLFLAGKRLERDHYRLLSLHSSAAQGDPKALRRTIEKAMRDVG